MATMATPELQTHLVRAVGRRKTASARVRLAHGTGEVTINGKPLAAFFPLALFQKKVTSPFLAIGQEKVYDTSVKVAGGGVASQAEAVRHGIARALLTLNPDFRPLLRAHGYLTRDPRAKERKKFGLRRARRAHQWRKR